MNFLEKYGLLKKILMNLWIILPKDDWWVRKTFTISRNKSSILKNLGTEVYKEIFINYPDMFLLDASTFENRFSQYEADELLKSLNNNFKVVEYL